MKTDKAYSTTEINSSGVYKIINTITNDVYIGSSSNFRTRRNQHSNALRKNKHANHKLQNSINKYGFSNFVFSIVEYCKKEEVRFVEQAWLDKEKPTLNISSKAEALMCPKIKEDRDAKLRKRYFLINPSGIQMCTNNLKEFCKQQKILRDNIAHLLVEKQSGRQYYKGWFITTDPAQLKEENRYSKEKWIEDNKQKYAVARAEYTTYIWDTKTDKQYVIGNVDNKTHLTLHSFCKEFNLGKESIRTAFNKNKKNYKHFVIYRIEKTKKQPSLQFLNNYYKNNKDFKVKKQRATKYIYLLTSPQGKEYIITRDIKSFCEEHSLDPSSLIKVAKGKLPHYKQWGVKRELK